MIWTCGSVYRHHRQRRQRNRRHSSSSPRNDDACTRGGGLCYHVRPTYGKELLMRKLFVTLCSGALLVGGLSLRAMAADSKTVEGELVDTHCYSAGGAKGEDHGKTCGAKCAKSGIPVAVLLDGKAWT